MASRDWPGPIQAVRDVLPAEVRVLRGVLGFLSGVFLLGSVVRLLLAGNWHLGFGDDRVLASVFLVLVPAALGVGSPLWYWLGRPLWIRFDRPAVEQLRPPGRVRFLPGLLGAVLGVWLLLQVEATAGFWRQTLAPFGLAIAIGTPLWFWLLRPYAGHEIDRRLPAALTDPDRSSALHRAAVAIVLFLVASVALTSVTGLPIVGVGETVTDRGLAVSITDSRVVDDVTDADGDDGYGTHAWRLLLVEVSVENRDDVVRRVPGASVLEISTIAPICSAQTFGEPGNNCNEASLDGNFAADGQPYANYGDRQSAIGGELEPGSRLSGWLVFRLEGPPDDGSGVRPIVVVDGVGRWRLGDVSSG